MLGPLNSVNWGVTVMPTHPKGHSNGSTADVAYLCTSTVKSLVYLANDQNPTQYRRATLSENEKQKGLGCEAACRRLAPQRAECCRAHAEALNFGLHCNAHSCQVVAVMIRN